MVVGGGGTPSSHGGGVPHPVMVGQGTPSRPGQGVPHPVMMGITPHHPDLGWGSPHHPDLGWVPPTIQTWDGVPHHHPDLGWGTPHHPDLGWGTPHYSDLGWGTPIIQTWDGVPPQSRPGMGYPPHHPDLGQGTPPQKLNRHTPVKTLPPVVHMYAGDNKVLCVRRNVYGDNNFYIVYFILTLQALLKVEYGGINTNVLQMDHFLGIRPTLCP